MRDAKKKPATTPSHPPEFCFAEQLRGEDLPSFATMKALYEQALQLLVLRPWELLEEDRLIVVRVPDNKDDCYCSVMGSIGQVFSIYVYVGLDSYALFRKISIGDALDPADFLANVHSVAVEYVSNKELQAPDRALLTALGFTPGRGKLTPIFRAVRPGYRPWFVTAEEAALLAVCLRAVKSICQEMIHTGAQQYWSHPGIFPLLVAEADSWRVEPIKPVAPDELPLPPARLAPEELARLRNQDYPVRGIIELDYFATLMAVGGRNERKACTAVALAVDAKSGFLFSPALTSPPNPGESLVKAICGAIDAGKAYPAEIHLRSKRLKDCIAAVAKTLGVPLRVAPRLPAFDEAREGLLEFMAR